MKEKGIVMGKEAVRGRDRKLLKNREDELKHKDEGILIKLIDLGMPALFAVTDGLEVDSGCPVR